MRASLMTVGYLLALPPAVGLVGDLGIGDAGRARG
jgi:hypothetical protein